MVKLGNDWDEILSDEFEKPYYLELREFLKEEYRTKSINIRTRSIPWRKSSSWIGIFGTTKCSDTAIVTKYI